MKLIQIPYSHNCLKVRIGLALKGLDYERQDIPPASRKAVVAASGQPLVPVLVDDGQVLVGSTRILLHLDDRHPDPPLVPRDPAAGAECRLLADWADRAFMALARRIAYHGVLSRRGQLGRLFYPGDSAFSRAVKETIARRVVVRRFAISEAGYRRDLDDAREAAGLAVARLGGRAWLLGDAPTLADVALAAMSAPLIADGAMRSHRDVAALLAWGSALVPADVSVAYRNAAGC